MTDFERSTTVGVGADAAFAFLSDPARLPAYVATVTHVDSIAVDGDPAAGEEEAAPDEAVQVRFLADTATRTVDWGGASSDYGGSMTVTPGTASTSGVTIRLRTRDDVDAVEVDRVFDQVIRNLQRLLSGR